MALLRIPGLELPDAQKAAPKPQSQEAEPLARLAAFVQFLREIPWFSHVGKPVDSQARLLAVDYLAALGFTDCSVVYVKSWEEAADACAGLDPESFWQMEEDRLAQEALTQALEQVPTDELNLAFTHLTAELARVIPARLRQLEDDEEELEESLLDAAFGSAVHHVQAAAAAVAAGCFDETHPFRYRFTLFSLGHWPIGIVGRSFVIF